MKAEVEPTGMPTNACFTRRTPLARQFSSTSAGSAWWSATKKNSRTGSTPARVRHPEGRRGVDHAVEPAGQAALVGVEELDAAAGHQVPVLRVAEAAREDAHLPRPQLLQHRAQQDGAAQRVGIAHPLGEDVGAAAADGLGAALQAHVGGVGLGQDGQVLLRAPLAQDGAEAGHHHVGAGQTRGLQHAGRGGHPRGRAVRLPVAAIHRALLRLVPVSASGMKAAALLRQIHEHRGGGEARRRAGPGASPASPPRSARPGGRGSGTARPGRAGSRGRRSRPRRRRAASGGCPPAGTSTASLRKAKTRRSWTSRASTSRRAPPSPRPRPARSA